ncbi:PRC-barrel domain-containing protein [Halobellus captivus]|uniref:PRC-barrel domain-containing protein n=1 Tax=Halobellus captivus TaxID=2592614 RepID=UPI0011A587F8|nr:PRC-barrel domain-containing protein [Halobellus captivus]
MPDELAEDLSGKGVMGSNGAQLGELYNVEINVKTGAIGDLLVSPYEETNPNQLGFETDTDENEQIIRIPVSHVQDVRDYIVVQP